MKKTLIVLISLLVVLLAGYILLMTWTSKPAAHEVVGGPYMVDASELIREKLIQGEVCYTLKQEDCFHVFTGLYDLYQKSFEYGTTTLRVTGTFGVWPISGEYDYSSMPRFLENFLISCDLKKNTCKYRAVKTVGKIPKKFNEATKTFEDYSNYYMTDTGNERTFRIIKKDAEMVTAEYSFAPQECGIERIILKLETKEVIKLYSSACKSADFLTDSQINAM